MTAVETALEVWRTQLSLSARRSLVVDWQDRLRVLPFATVPSSALERLLRLEVVPWADIALEVGEGDANRIDPLLERSDESFRERGNPGLNIVLGTAVIPGIDGEMPLVLLPLTARRRARRLPDIDVEAIGPLSMCPSTVDILRRDFAVQFDVPTVSIAAVTDALVQLTQRTDLPDGVALSVRAGLAVQASNWLDVQRDLERFEAARDSLLVRALAGDSAARQQVRRPDETEPDGSGPLVLPADASQREVLRRVRRGTTMIVEGPPGTGKSQTIANLLAGSVVEGRSVLFVAQKRAAVDVVVSRLREVGLDHLVLDVHDDTARFQPIGIDADPTGPVRLVPPSSDPPDLTVAARHADAVIRAWPRLADLLRRGGAMIPDIDDRVLDSLLDRVEQFKGALRAFSAARNVLTECGFQAPPPVLRLLLGKPVELSGAADALGILPSSTATVSAAIDSAAFARTIAQISGHIGSDSVIPPRDAAVTDAIVLRLYRGPYLDLASKRAMVTAFLRATDALRAAGVVPDGFTAGRIVELANHPGWEVLATLPSEASQHVRTTDPQALALRHVSPVAASVVLRRLAACGNLMPTGALDLLAELELQGLLDVVMADADPEGLFNASVAEGLVRRLPLARAVDLSEASRTAGSMLEKSRRIDQERIAAVARQRRLDHIAAEDSVESLLAYEGFARHARTRKVRNADVLGSATSTALAFFPIVVASPTGAARSLPQIPELFDLVVFDEASQLETAVAVSSLARAKQAVVFGDSLQLPPDRFFQGSGPSVSDAVLSQNSLLDSIATLLTGTDRTAYLRWHYRSLDGGLVRFVNDAPTLYGGRMQLVPAPPSDISPTKLVLATPDTLLEVVASELHAIPAEQTCAVVTLGIEMADRLSVGLDMPLSPDDLEPNVVRNIERFQGDERDHVILVLPSVGPSTSALQALGPINAAGGERRLNVALTRARQRLTVVSTFDQAALAGAQSPGAVLLRDFLRYLQLRRTVEFRPAVANPGSDDPIDVMQMRLLNAGLDVWRPTSDGCPVELVVRCVDGSSLVVDVDTPRTCAMDAFDRELLLPEELKRRGWRRIRTTIRDWIDRPDEIVTAIRAEAAGSP